MLRKNSIMSYVIIVVLAAVFIFTVNATAQTNDDEYTSEEQGEKKPIPQEGLQSSLKACLIIYITGWSKDFL